ncbi:MAG TPA: penicillin-binding protein 2 [Candidatus Aminicenantes bacterium]|nr:penicillin-binding protein 2 [Candidatus Aminicenantes bacterium]HRY65080.1 penicillin-binding protein 2 [Candidatus Aminicenantes bacterium]HRZ71993.1 penicillin-binding protein 2 [Candidatus Aminicenantes bacterium]
MRSFYESDIRRRIKFLAAVLAVWCLVVAGRLVQIQIFGHARAKAIVQRQTQDMVKIEPRRGSIFDRNGEILACSLDSPSVAIRHIDRETAGQERDKVLELQRALDLPASEASRILGRLRDQAKYTYVKKRIPEEEAAAALALKLAGVELEPATRRYYPHGALAAHILGGMSPEGENRSGVEARYHDRLKGQPGQQITYEVGGGRNYQAQVLKSPVPGQDLTLTIDATMQYIVEKELARAIVEHQAAWGSVIVMDPPTGEILALANWPAYDVNQYPYPPEAEANRAVQASYEPGSTFKIVTAAAARERGRVGYGELFDCSAGSIRVGGTVITDHERVGILSFPQVLIHSSNVGTVLFAQRLTVPEYLETIKGFGFGARTGVDLPRESSGRVWPANVWTKSSLPHVAIGYEVRVTALQTLVAMNAFAVGGRLVRPHVVRGAEAAAAGTAIEDGDNAGRAVSPKTAAELVDRVFAEVVEQGTAKDGRIDGFGAAGKTGTAQKYDDALKSYTKKYTASFVGFTPLERPRLSLIVVLDAPKEAYYGGQACAPVFRDIAGQILRYLRVAPERPLPPDDPKAGRRKEKRA